MTPPRDEIDRALLEYEESAAELRRYTDDQAEGYDVALRRSNDAIQRLHGLLDQVCP